MADQLRDIIDGSSSSTPKEIDNNVFMSSLHLGLKPLFDTNDAPDINNTVPCKNDTNLDSSPKKPVKYDAYEKRPNLRITYKKQLDKNLCTPFNSPEGRLIFKRSICTKYMNVYFVLSQHLHTQSECNLCGSGSLVVVLNSLEVDPRRMWQYPWRWYDEYMMNSCVPVERMAAQGIGFNSFLCLARCNKLAVEASRMSLGSSIEQFRYTF